MAHGIGEGVTVVPDGRHLVKLQTVASGPYRSVGVRPGEVAEEEVSVPPPKDPVDAAAEMTMGDSAPRRNAQLDPLRPNDIGAIARIRVTLGPDGSTRKE